MLETFSSLRVRYAETDQMGVVYYSRYFEYFEVGRLDLLRCHGVPYSEIEMSLGFWLPVVEAFASFRKGAVLEDELVIRTAIKERPSARMRFDYEVSREGSTLVSGYTVHACVEKGTRKVVAASAVFSQLVERWNARG